MNLKWGISKNNVVPQEVKDGIRQHINSLPCVESHYNRANTKKEYLADGLNITILYEEYVKKCEEAGTTPGKLHLYRQILIPISTLHSMFQRRTDAIVARQWVKMKIRPKKTRESMKNI